MPRALLLLLAMSACVLVDDPTLDARLDPDGDGSPHPEDCDSEDASVYPEAAELCDGVDQNCDGEIDEGVGDTLYSDADGDGFGDAAAPLVACEAGAGVVPNADDCDDGNDAIHPGAAETDCQDPVDYNCDGSTGQEDADGDGAVACDDCDDADVGRYPGAPEVCDDVDQDCDGLADDDASDAATWFADTDGDGFGDQGTSVASCAAPAGYVADATDCDDADAEAFPAASETCDPGDDDCDGDVDEDATDATLWYADVDADGFGDAGAGVAACDAPEGHVGDDTDCDDGDAAFHPGADESDCADPADYNCDGSVAYADLDGDGFAACEDCDDTRDDVSPDGVEVCGDVDEDCDGAEDEAGAVGESTWYADADEDGYGDPGVTDSACDAPAGYGADGTDCDDTTAAVSPAAAERCDDADVDEDCDGVADDASATGQSAWYADADADGFGDAVTVVNACEAPTSYVADATDCDDGNAGAFPGAASNDSTTACMKDDDGDDFGDEAVSGATVAGTDCDDTTGTVSPGEVETCDNGIDDDCDGGAGTCAPGGGSLADADAEYDGQAGDAAAYSLGSAGDVNADGFGDLLVGARSNSAGGYISGAAYLVLGSAAPGSLDLRSADAQFTGSSGEYAGRSVSSAGDVDADGFGDLLVGAPYQGGGYAGAAYLILGGATPGDLDLVDAAAQYTGPGGANAGDSVAAAGDVNDDGFDDILIGAPFRSTTAGRGNAYLVLGGATPASLDLGSADARYTGEADYDRGGMSVASAGDFDADGFPDVLVGADGNDDAGTGAGAAYLVLGGGSVGDLSLSAADARYTGEAAGDAAGFSVSGAGDVDGDGFDDLLIGAYGNNDGGSDAGAAYLVLGASLPVDLGLASADAEYTGESAGDNAGDSVSTARDVDGDGLADLIVGAYLNDAAGADSGAAYLVLGSTGPTSLDLGSADARYTGEAAGDNAGKVCTAGDVDADGFDDLLVGGDRNVDGGASAGAAYLIRGSGL